MQLHSYRGNIHMHSTASDGTGSIADLVAAARRAGLHYIIVTDHNRLVAQSEEGWREGVLTLIDIEVNDRRRQPEQNHCLTLGVREDVSDLAADPQALIDGVRERGGLSFLAHPIDKPSPLMPDTYPWTEWDIEGFTGIELWNFMSEFRPYATNKLKGLLISFFPHWFTRGPFPETLALWDRLLLQHPTVAIGGSDAHAQVYHLGPIARRVFPYEVCFAAVNTHIISEQPFSGEPSHDRRLVYDALREGRCWVAYDRLHASEGFSFTAHSGEQTAIMGQTLRLQSAATLRVSTPAPARLRLIRVGTGVVAETRNSQLSYVTDQPGIYRLEAWKWGWGRLRGWIFSNAIVVA